jgi:hypothetical protein
MIKSAITVLTAVVFTAICQAEEFNSEPAKNARKKYEESLTAAREAYLKDLGDAALKAAEAGDLDEVVRIKDEKEGLSEENGEDDKNSLAKARKRLEGTTWKWKPLGTFEIRSTFMENRRAKHASNSGEPPHYGAWDMLDERTIVMRRQPEGLWIFFIEDDWKSFKVMKLAPVEYKGTVGTPLK